MEFYINTHLNRPAASVTDFVRMGVMKNMLVRAETFDSNALGSIAAKIQKGK